MVMWSPLKYQTIYSEALSSNFENWYKEGFDSEKVEKLRVKDDTI